MKPIVGALVAAILFVCPLGAPALADPLVITDAAGKQRVIDAPPERNPTMSTVASLLIAGTGQALNGEWGKGLAFLGGQVVVASALGGGQSVFASPAFLPMMAIQIYSSVEAGMTADRLNSERQNIIKVLSQRQEGRDKK